MKKPDEKLEKKAPVQQLQSLGEDELALLARLLPPKDGQLDTKLGTQVDDSGFTPVLCPKNAEKQPLSRIYGGGSG